MKIFLIGMPGAGKTTVGKQLAHKLSKSFIDLDTEIEKQEKKLVKNIFVLKGEEYFRRLESDKLQDIIQNKDNFVLATGGGTPCFHGGIEVINKAGMSIFLNVPVNELMLRIKDNVDRPLLFSKDKEELEEKLIKIYNYRLPYYNLAKIVADNSDINQLLNLIDLKSITES